MTKIEKTKLLFDYLKHLEVMYHEDSMTGHYGWLTNDSLGQRIVALRAALGVNGAVDKDYKDEELRDYQRVFEEFIAQEQRHLDYKQLEQANDQD